MVDSDTAEKIGMIGSDVKYLVNRIDSISRELKGFPCYENTSRIKSIERWQSRKMEVAKMIKNTIITTFITAIVGGAVVYISGALKGVL